MWNHMKELKNRNYDEINIKLEKKSRRKKSEKIETFFDTEKIDTMMK